MNDMFRFMHSAIDMTQITVWLDHISNPLLEGLDIGEATIALAFPEQLAIDSDLEPTTVRWLQGYLLKTLAKSRQQLLGVPAATQQPLTLRTVDNSDS